MSETIEAQDQANNSNAAHIQNMGLLDLRSAKTPEDIERIASISNVGCVLLTEELIPALVSRVKIENVGAIIPIPAGNNIQVQAGQVWLTGEALAAGNPDNILVIAGQLFITTPVTSVGYQSIHVHGQLMAIRGSETALGAKLGNVTGNVLYLPANARNIFGSEEIGKDFLELLREPTALVVMGKLTFEDDVTVDLLRSKVLEIVLMGKIETPRSLYPLVQILAVEKMGNISVKE